MGVSTNHPVANSVCRRIILTPKFAWDELVMTFLRKFRTLTNYTKIQDAMYSSGLSVQGHMDEHYEHPFRAHKMDQVYQLYSNKVDHRNALP